MELSAWTCRIKIWTQRKSYIHIIAECVRRRKGSAEVVSGKLLLFYNDAIVYQRD